MQPVELLPLPEGVAEEVPVICNGRSGLLLLRSQRVLHNGGTMSASRFETVCGKGDAKKWKCSVHLEPSPGLSGQVQSGAWGVPCDAWQMGSMCRCLTHLGCHSGFVWHHHCLAQMVAFSVNATAPAAAHARQPTTGHGFCCDTSSPPGHRLHGGEVQPAWL